MQRRATRGETGLADSRSANIRTFAIVCVFAVAAIGVVLFLAPEKPEAPPASSVTYEPPPKTSRQGEIGPAPSFASRTKTPDAAPTTDEGIMLRGVVVDIDTGDPIDQAQLDFSRVVSDEEYEELKRIKEDEGNKAYIKALDATTGYADGGTDESGFFAVSFDTEGRYNLTVKHRDYVKKNIDGVEVRAEGLNEDMIIELSRGAMISGAVRESSGRRPAVGVNVMIEGGANYGVQTDENGQYTLSGLTPGSYQVSVNVRGSSYIVERSAPVRNVDILTDNDRINGIDFAVGAAGVVWGYITDHNDEPIEGMEAVLVSSESLISQAINAAVRRAPPISDSSDEEGYYELKGVPLESEWRVYAMSDQKTPQLSDPFVITSARREVRVDLYIVDGTNVTGRVIDAVTGDGVPSASVACIPVYSRFFSPVDKPRAFRDVQTDEEGRFTLPNFPQGEYQVLAHKDGYKIITTGTRFESDGIGDVHSVIVELTPVGLGDHTVYGTVRTANGEAIQDARLELAAVSTLGTSLSNNSTTTDATGKFEFRGIEPGYFMLHVNAEGYAERTVETVRLNEPTSIVLDATGTVSGKVLIAETSAPPESGSVRAVPEYSEERGGVMSITAQMDPRSTHFGVNGEFTLELPAGSYRLEAQATGYTPGRESVEIEEGDSESGVTIYVSRRGGSIRGRVVTSTGDRPGGAVVHVYDAGNALGNIFAPGGNIAQSGISVGDDGEFVFSQLPAGVYTLTAKHPDFAAGVSQPIMLDPFDDRTDVEILLTEGGAVQGYVLEEGEPQVGTVINAVGAGTNFTTTSDANGQYIFERLSPGIYLLSAVNVNDANLSTIFSPRHARVEVFEGQVTTHNFGENTGIRVDGIVAPPPQEGELGFALLVLPGSLQEVLTLNMTNPFAWFSGDLAQAGSQVVGMTRIGRDGIFSMENILPGTYELAIIYAGMGSVLTSTPEITYQQIIDVPPGEDVQVQIQLTQ